MSTLEWMSFGALMQFVRTHFRGDIKRNGSVAKVIIRRFGMREAECMIRGAHALGWTDLISLNAKEGLARSWARRAFWDRMKKSPGPSLEDVGTMLKKAGLV